MKKVKVFVINILITMLLCSCSQVETQYVVEKNGIEFKINSEAKTIYDGTNVYKFNFAGNKSEYEIDITYPDGSTYWSNMNNGSGSGGWSNDYNPEKYIDGDILTNIILNDAPKALKHSEGEVIAVIILVLLGIFNIAAPQLTWYLHYGWRYQDAEPSDFALTFNRIGGIIIIIIALIMLFT